MKYWHTPVAPQLVLESNAWRSSMTQARNPPPDAHLLCGAHHGAVPDQDHLSIRGEAVVGHVYERQQRGGLRQAPQPEGARTDHRQSPACQQQAHVCKGGGVAGMSAVYSLLPLLF
jgi:hypothetical protein